MSNEAHGVITMNEQANEPANAADERDSPRRFVWLQWIGWLLVGLVLYVLSIGPVAGVATLIWGPEPSWPEWFEAGAATVYLPLAWVAGAIPGGVDTLLAYVGFWESMAR